MIIMYKFWWPCTLVLAISGTSGAPQRPPAEAPNPETYHVQNNDKSYQFGYQTKDHFHHGDGDRNNFVRGEFGSRNPATGVVDQVQYTAGPRGFRPRGKNVARKYDLSQVGPRPVGSKDDPYFDPNEDPSYNFGFRTRTYNREEGANRLGDVTGRYSYVDDIGERHNVEYIAGKNTGFHVRTPFPDSNPNSIGPLFYKGPGKPGEKPRGRTSIQRGLDGSYKFVSAGPDQRRTETSDATGHVRGSYTFIDDKGVQHSVHYIAGPETGYRVLKNVKAPHFPSWYPLEPSRPAGPILPSLPPSPSRPGQFRPPGPDFGGEDYGDGDKIEDIFGGPQEQLSTAASGHAKPSKPPSFGASEEKDDGKPPAFDNDFGGSFDDTVGGGPSSTPKPPFGGGSGRPPFNGGGPQKPFLDSDLGDGGFLPRPSTTRQPFGGGPSKPSFLDEEEDGGFGGRPSSTRPPFGNGATGPSKPFLDQELQGDFFPKPSSTRKPYPGDDGGSTGFGATGGGPAGATGPSDAAFMDDLFKPSGPTGSDIGKPPGPTGSDIGKPSQRPGRPQDFGGFDGGRPSSTRPPFGEESSRPFGEEAGGGASGGDDFELFGGDKGKPGSGRPSYGGSSKEDMNYGFFDGSKGPGARPPQRPASKEEGFDFFGGDKGPGGPSSTAGPGSRPFGRPPSPPKDEGFDFFSDDKLRPGQKPGGGATGPGPTGGAGGAGGAGAPSKDDFDFFGNGNGEKGPTEGPFRPPQSGTNDGDDYSFSEREPSGRPPFAAGPPKGPGEISGPINVATSYDGVAVRAHVQSIDFLPYGSRIPSPSEQLKSDSRANRIHIKRQAKTRKNNDDDDD